MGGALCSKYDELSYDPVMESPAAYVAAQRKLFHRQMAQMQVTADEEVNTDEMTVEELRAYYDAGGKSRL